MVQPDLSDKGMCVNNLPKVVTTRRRSSRGSNSRPPSHQFDALANRLLSRPPSAHH